MSGLYFWSAVLAASIRPKPCRTDPLITFDLPIPQNYLILGIRLFLGFGSVLLRGAPVSRVPGVSPCSLVKLRFALGLRERPLGNALLVAGINRLLRLGQNVQIFRHDPWLHHTISSR